jgi:DNA-binding NarL/FixJ family response regulator
MSACSIRVVVADDHAEMLKVISDFLSEHFCVLAVVASGDSLIQVVAELKPDVVVSDVDMPSCSGVEAMLELREMGVEVPFVLMGTEVKGILPLLHKGAAAYVHKYDMCADLVRAVLLAKKGDRFLSRSVADPVN